MTSVKKNGFNAMNSGKFSGGESIYCPECAQSQAFYPEYLTNFAFRCSDCGHQINTLNGLIGWWSIVEFLPKEYFDAQEEEELTEPIDFERHIYED